MTNEDWVILSTNDCPYCHAAKKLLSDLGYQFVVYDVKEHKVLREFMEDCGLFTVPQIYRNGRLVGGFEQLSHTLAFTGPKLAFSKETHVTRK